MVSGRGEFGPRRAAPIEVEAVDVSPSGAGRRGTGRGRRRFSVGRVVVALVVLAAIGIGAFRVVQLSGERNDLQTRNDELAESLRVARGDAGEQIEALETDVAELTEQLAVADASIETASTDLTDALAERDGLIDLLTERTDELNVQTERADDLDAQLTELGGRVEPMPDVVGADLATVEEFATDIGATLLVDEVAPGNVIARPGAVIEQRPAEGTAIVSGSVIWVQVFTLDESPGDG